MLVLVLGCGNNKRTGTSTAPATGSAAVAGMSDTRAACGAAIAEAAKTGRTGEVFSPEDEKFSAEIAVVMTESCAATEWPEFVLMCLTHGSTREELHECTKPLTPLQRQDMMERVLVVTKKHEASPVPAAKPVP